MQIMRRRQRRGSAATEAGRRADAKSEYWGIRNVLPATRWDYLKVEDRGAFLPPENFSIVENYEETLAFIMDVRYLFHERQKHLCDDGIRRKIHADFSGIKTIDPASGLVLAAEIDRWSKGTGRRPRALDHLWHKNVRDYFVDAGLFDLLKIDPHEINELADGEPLRQSLKMITGTLADGASARQLRIDLENLCGRGIGPRTTVYDALSEALANVSHAYPRWRASYPGYRARRWWASGSWTPSSKTVSVQLYDQGVGIPRTLPRREYWGRIMPLVRRLDPERTDAGLIEAALEYGRTSTRSRGRGMGLKQMTEWINTQGHGFLRITSGSGCVTYRANRKVERRNLSVPFCGTLIEWEFRFDD